MARIKVDTTSLTSDLGTLEENLGYVEEKLKSNESELEITQEFWKGQALSELRKDYSGTVTNLRKIMKALSDDMAGMKMICGIYEKCEREVADRISRITIS